MKLGTASFIGDREFVGKFLTVAATIIVPYALWPLVMVWAVFYFSVLGVRRAVGAPSSRPAPMKYETEPDTTVPR